MSSQLKKILSGESIGTQIVNAVAGKIRTAALKLNVGGGGRCTESIQGADRIGNCAFDPVQGNGVQPIYHSDHYYLVVWDKESSRVIVMDSVRGRLNETVQTCVGQLLGSFIPNWHKYIKWLCPQEQEGSADSGIFVLAWMMAYLIGGADPSTMPQLIQADLRSHLARCLESDDFTPPPQEDPTPMLVRAAAEQQ